MSEVLVVGNLWMQTKSVKSAKRMTKKILKMETETILVEFESNVIPKELYHGFMRYSVREYIQKPMRCFNCQEFGNVAKVCKDKRRCNRCETKVPVELIIVLSFADVKCWVKR